MFHDYYNFYCTTAPHVWFLLLYCSNITCKINQFLFCKKKLCSFYSMSVTWILEGDFIFLCCWQHYCLYAAMGIKIVKKNHKLSISCSRTCYTIWLTSFEHLWSYSCYGWRYVASEDCRKARKWMRYVIGWQPWERNYFWRRWSLCMSYAEIVCAVKTTLNNGDANILTAKSKTERSDAAKNREGTKMKNTIPNRVKYICRYWDRYREVSE